MYLIPAGILAVIFAYTLYSKIINKNTVGLHRHPEDIRRSHRETPEYNTGEYKVLVP